MAYFTPTRPGSVKSFGIITHKRRLLHLSAQGRSNIGRDGNTAHTTLGIKPMGSGVFARQLDKIQTTADPLLANPRQIASGIFHSDDPGQFCQFAHRLGAHIDYRTRWDVIDDYRQVAAVMKRRKMRDQSCLRRLVIIWRDHKNRIGTRFLGALRKTDGFECVVATRTRDHRKATGSGAHNFFDDFIVLVVG